MSIVGLLLGWTGLPKWASELVLIGIVAAGAVIAAMGAALKLTQKPA